MKKYLPAFLLFAAMLSGCVRPSDFKVTSFRIVSVTPTGLRTVDAVVEVGILNPTVGVTAEDISGTLKLGAMPCILVTAENMVLKGKSEEIYRVPVKGELADGVSLLSVLPVLVTPERGDLSIDVDMKVVAAGILSRHFSFRDKKIKL